MIDYTADGPSAVLKAHAEKAEQSDRPAPESLEALRKAGTLALRTPREYGGAWAGVSDVGRQLARLAEACPSTAWVAGTCATAKDIAVRCFPDSVARRVFADPDALFCGSGVPAAHGVRVPEGVRINGRWANVSGCEDAVWATLGLMVDDRFCFAVVPVADLAVERAWHMAGMRGTGSQTLVAEDCLVPDGQVVAAEPFALKDLLLYSIAALGPVIGAARGALHVMDEMFASNRKPFMTTYSRMGESPGARHWLAEAAHLVNRAERAMFAVAQTADSGELSQADGTRLHMDLANAGQDCRSAMDRMLDLHGTSGFNTANALQRFWRDVAVGSRHPHLNLYLATERFGMTLAGPPQPE